MGINIERDAKKEYERGLKCHLWGVDVKDMTKDELVVFVGFLDELVAYERQFHGYTGYEDGRPTYNSNSRTQTAT